MRKFAGVTLGVTAMLALGGPSLFVRAEQAAPPPVQAGPFDALHFRPIGPASMSGRISDLAVYEADPNIFYVGTAHGGVWKTVNNGTTFEPQMQDQGLLSVGDVAVSQSNPDLVYVGSGESNNRQSTSWGDGVYKSTDGGKHYANVGLRSSRHINRVVIDPRNTDTVFVAATGPLFGPGGERGVFKTTDGGKTWRQALKGDDDTGANDLVMDPANSQVLYASLYQRRRTVCCMNGGGPGSGLFKSTDGGETWTRLKSGLPEGPLGRIAIDVYRRRPDTLYASIEGPAPAGRGGRAGGAGTASQAAGGRGATTTAEGAEETAQAPQVGGGRGPARGVDATPTGLYRSDDGGATWRKVNNVNARPMYFSQVRVDPNDPDVVYMGGVGLHQSTDGGKTVATDAAEPIHDDIHAIWIDPANSRHVIIGNDGGLAYSYDMAKTWGFVPNLPVGLFYHASVDMATPFNVCGGMQDNYDWCGPSQVRGTPGIANHHWTTIQGGDGFVVLQDPKDPRVLYSESQDGNLVRVDRVTNETMSIRPQPPQGEAPYRWHWDTPVILSPHDPGVVYAAANRVFRSADRGLSWTLVSGDLTSNANRDEIVTMGVKGSEITIARNDGIGAWPTIVSLAESPKRAGLLYAGTDDGNLQVSRDAGKTWTNVYGRIPGAPAGAFVSEVVPSRFDEGTVYVTIDDHRRNNYETFIYASADYGQTWKALNGNLRGEVIKTLTEDQKNADVLYVGAETGLFVSIDRGGAWIRPKTNLPTVRIDEITLHPRDNAMVLATHGRALWILDHLEPIQEYAAVQNTEAKLFTPPPTSMFRRPARDRNYEFWGSQVFYGENPPQAALISWYLKHNVNDVQLKIADATGREVREIAGAVLAKSNTAGIQTVCWDLRVQPIPLPPGSSRGSTGLTGSGSGVQATAGGQSGAPQEPPPSPFGAGCTTPGGGFGGFGGGAANAGPYVLPGVYNVSLVVGGKTVDTKPLRVAGDPEVVLTDAQKKKLFDMAMELHELQRPLTDAASGVTSLNRQATQIAQTLAERNDIPADVKASFDAFKAEVGALVPTLAIPQGRGFGGGGRGAADQSVLGRLGQAKNGLMGGMWPTEQTMRGHADAKVQVPKAVADANALFAKAALIAASLAQVNVTLTVPPSVNGSATTKRKTTTSQ